jgi:enamine deaminase RidA (YjgF/YER057c/UK114 family)
MNEIEREAGLPETAGYRYAKRIDNQLHVSGQVPHDSTGEIVGEDDPGIQARQCLVNLEVLLKVHGFNNNDIQHMTVYVVGERDNLSLVWSAVKDAFPHGVPPATLLGVTFLGYENQLVEIDATIAKDS